MAKHEHEIPKKNKNKSTPFVKSGELSPVEIERLKTTEWVKNNLPPARNSRVHPLNGLTKEEYMKICYGSS